MKIVFLASLCAMLMGLFIAGAGCSRHSAHTPPKAVIQEYHGIKVTDPYQWLENGTNASVRNWTALQNTKARAHLDKLPTRPMVADQLERMFAQASPNYSGLKWQAGKLFLLKFQPPAQQPVLVTFTSTQDRKTEKVVLDLNVLSPDGAISIDWFVPSLDGSKVAVCLSENGSEDGTLWIYDATTGTALPDKIPRVQYPTGGGSAAWNEDGTGIYYTRYPAPGERAEADAHFYQQIFYHKLGTPGDQDTYEAGKDFPRIAEIELKSSADGRQVLAQVANGDGGDYAHYLRTLKGEWKQVTRFEDQVKRAEFGRDPLYVELGRNDSLYLLSTKDAPKGKILRLKLSQPDLAKATVSVAESTNVIQSFKPTASGMAIVYLRGGAAQFRYQDFLNTALSGPSSRSVQPDFRIPTSIDEMLVTGGDEILFRTETYTEPFIWWRFDANKTRDNAEATSLKGTSPAIFTDVEAVRVTATSKDGTGVPMTIIKKKGTRLDGENPTVLEGYGGYGISITPNFDFTRRLWFDQGGVLAIANLRGGGEFGEEWHKAGNLTRKQNVFDDFAACADWLVRSNYTKPAKLAIQGGSNGGLLMGAMLTQHPEKMRAVISHVGVYDMLRVELDPNGAFNVTEFGSVTDPEQFKALHAYSPYHRVQDQTAYPSVLMMTGEHDGRVNPAHSRKMTARLQAATSSGHPVLLRTSSSSGHGVGTALNEYVEQLADVYAFLIEQLGIDYTQVERGPLSGGVSSTSATIKAKLAREGLMARLVVSTNPTLANPFHSSVVRSDSNRYSIVTFPLENLDPGMQYFYGLEIDGRLDRKKRGQFKTFPAPGPASFKIAFASCGRTGSTRDVFDRIREHNPLFYMSMGDFHYQDIRTNKPAAFRSAYDMVLASPQQADLYRNVPLVYMWDDHDYGGNNANKKSTTHQAARNTYDEYVPHYPLVDTQEEGAIYQSFTVGRVKFIITDLRSYRDDPKDKDDAKKSIMGTKQKAWLKQELLEANGKYPLICWMSTVPWIGEAGKSPYRTVKTNEFGYIHHTNLVSRTNTAGTVGAAEAADKATNATEVAEADAPDSSDTSSATNGITASGNTVGNRTTNTANRATARRGGNRAAGRGANPNGGGGDEDHWSVFTTERREIADFIKANGIRGVCIVHGDSHMLAADDGTHSDYATGKGAPIPVMCAGPLDQNPSMKGGPYSQGVYRVRDKEGESGFGLLDIQDRGTAIDVSFSGRNNRDEEKISLRFSVPSQGTSSAQKK